MKYLIFLKGLASALVLCALVGCGTTKHNEQANFADGGSSKFSRANALQERVQFYGEEISAKEESDLRKQDTFHFAYDKYDLKEADLLSVYAHARYLITHPNAKVRIDGHTDQRGSREYNVALGEKRAKAIRNLLLYKGALPYQVETVSFGKEKLVSFEESEDAWQLNRRAEIHYVLNDAETR